MKNPENKPESSELEPRELVPDELDEVSGGGAAGPHPEPPDPC